MPPRPTHIAQHLKAAATNACGRLLRVDDGTGYQIFSYDRLGNVAENIRAIALPFEDSVYNFRMMFEYDSWNRVQRIVYPDSEVVTYNYDLGGNLNRVHTYKANHRDTLIKNILYDEFGHRTQVNFGNGVTTNYTYDNLQRLNTLQTHSNNASLQKIMYSFDLEDNITRVENTDGGANGLGGAYTLDYQYDNLYRLTSSTGSFTPTGESYFLEMHYTPAGRICRKEQGDNNATRRLLYSYNPHNAPHAARRIYDPSTTNLRQMLWDANGNIAQISEYLYDAKNEIVNLQDFRNHYWDEDDRLNLVLDNSHFSYYLYSNDGQRVAKLTGSAFTLGTGFATNALLDNYTLYPSEYLTITTQGYTKYYYANGTRIASKLGSGGFEKMTRLCTLDQNLTANANTLFNSVVANIGTAMPDYHISDPCPDYYPDIAGFRVQLQPLNFEPNFGITAQQNVLQAFRQNYANEETYYFHGNHLGSANWVTLQNASPTQFLLHLPYGEEFVKQLNSTYDERFTFTGKEKDIETGYYYFGARFDNVDLGFMSVDPQFDNLPSITPYNYCLWNPVILHDPDGEFPLWAIVGAAIDYGLQVYNNYNQGKTGVEAWTDINVVSVVGSAINPFSKVKAATTVAKVVKVAGEVAYETAQNAVEIRVDKNGFNVATLDAKDVAIKTATGYAAGKAGGKLYNSGSADAVKKANKGAQSAQNKLNRAQTKNANAPSAKTAQRVANAKSAQHTARAKQVRTNMAHATVGRSEGVTTTAVNTTAKVVSHKPTND